MLEAGVDARTLHPEAFPEALPSDEKFALWLSALDRRLAASQSKALRAEPVTEAAGIATLSRRGQSLTLKLHKSTGGFAEWLEHHLASEAEALYRAYLADGPTTSRSTAAKGAVTE